jgi:hypothetical protein
VNQIGDRLLDPSAQSPHTRRLATLAQLEANIIAFEVGDQEMAKPFE